jgi:hypothetical protein
MTQAVIKRRSTEKLESVHTNRYCALITSPTATPCLRRVSLLMR